MPNRSPAVALACSLLLLASGCGTITNFSEGRRSPGGPPKSKPFGGVREDIESATETEFEHGTGFVGILALVDLPFSLVGDVFTLPWAIKAARLRRAWPTEMPARVPGL